MDTNTELSREWQDEKHLQSPQGTINISNISIYYASKGGWWD